MRSASESLGGLVTRSARDLGLSLCLFEVPFSACLDSVTSSFVAVTVAVTAAETAAYTIALTSVTENCRSEVCFSSWL
jgi:hypothetical protein